MDADMLCILFPCVLSHNSPWLWEAERNGKERRRTTRLPRPHYAFEKWICVSLETEGVSAQQEVKGWRQTLLIKRIHVESVCASEWRGRNFLRQERVTPLVVATPQNDLFQIGPLNFLSQFSAWASHPAAKRATRWFSECAMWVAQYVMDF